jgi:glycosyltransferase involved in cell wall biosynthesis
MEKLNHNNLEREEGQVALVWLVIPVFNATPYLQECLDSIKQQSCSDFHVLIVDDGSTDNSIDIITDYCQQDSRFELIRSNHQGVSKARNIGIDAAKGKYIGFVDADDCLYPNSLQLLLDTITTTDSQVCIGNFTIAKEYSGDLAKATAPMVMSYTTAMRHALYQRYIFNAPWGMLMERQLLGDNIRFREGTRYEDLDAFYLFYEQSQRIAYIPSKVYFYRNAADSFIHQWSDSRLDALTVTDRIVEYMTNHYPELIVPAKDRQFSAYFNTLLLLLHYNIPDSATISKCHGLIKQRRISTLLNPHVRLKNKLGALLSYGGLPLLRLASRFYF